MALTSFLGCWILAIFCHLSHAWISSVPNPSLIPKAPLHSTPFEADLYANPFADENTAPSLAVPPDTQLVIGLNKYSHDTSLCAADRKTGNILFALTKERVSRQKHDAGNVATLVETCLENLDLQLENIHTVVVNNHHHRVLPLEANHKHLEWEAGLRINGGAEDGYTDPENLLYSTASKTRTGPQCVHHELSHHLAHAYSTATQAPFDEGMCVVMDGMGEIFRAMLLSQDDPTYTSDLSFGLDSFQCVPSDIQEQATQSSFFDWREAESIYMFNKTGTSIDLRPIFKRFTPEHSSPTLYNHGFENMDSLGAVYSRASSHILGDWNACGKVMGMAPWAQSSWSNDDGLPRLSPPRINTPILSGHLYSNSEETKLWYNRTLLEGIPLIARTDPDLFDDDGAPKKRYDFDDGFDDESGSEDPRIPSQVALEAIALASRVQSDLETVAMDWVRHFKEQTGAQNLCLAGGVALNSVLNGRLARELGFEQTFVSPYPGDDGIAVGCCAFGLFGNPRLEDRPGVSAPIWRGPSSPYLGPDPSEEDMEVAVDNASLWLDVEVVRNDDTRLKLMAEELEAGTVIAWYRGRSEMGPRALGHRSILADPRKKGLVRFINENVKSRESFRPFAPSVLAEEAHNWFNLGDNNRGNVSPYMSMTATVHLDKRDEIPAVTHVDGSSRLQTVTPEADPLYHKLISMFSERTGVPMVLNTSFNTLPGEPIVETPRDAIRSFLYSKNSIEILVLGDHVIRRKQADLQKLLGEASKEGYVMSEPALPKRSGPATFQTTADLGTPIDEDAKTKVRMPGRPVHGNTNEWFELLDELEAELLALCDGTITLSEIMSQYSSGFEGIQTGDKQKVEETENLLQNIVHRMVRLYENTLIGW